jgi:hypothetical protein
VAKVVRLGEAATRTSREAAVAVPEAQLAGEPGGNAPAASTEADRLAGGVVDAHLHRGVTGEPGCGLGGECLAGLQLGEATSPGEEGGIHVHHHHGPLRRCLVSHVLRDERDQCVGHAGGEGNPLEARLGFRGSLLLGEATGERRQAGGHGGTFCVREQPDEAPGLADGAEVDAAAAAYASARGVAAASSRATRTHLPARSEEMPRSETSHAAADVAPSST